MKLRVVVVTGEDGAVTRHMISEGERTGAGEAATLGLSLAEGKATLAGLQRVLVTAQADAPVGAVACAATVGRCARSRIAVPAGWCRCPQRSQRAHPASAPAAAAWPAGAA